MRIGEPIRVLQVEPFFYEPADGTSKEEKGTTLEAQKIEDELKSWALLEVRTEEVPTNERSNYT